MESERKKEIKNEIAILKKDIEVLNDIVKYVEENIDRVEPETVEIYSNHLDELKGKLRVVDLY